MLRFLQPALTCAAQRSRSAAQLTARTAPALSRTTLQRLQQQQQHRSLTTSSALRLAPSSSSKDGDAEGSGEGQQGEENPLAALGADLAARIQPLRRASPSAVDPLLTDGGHEFEEVDEYDTERPHAELFDSAPLELEDPFAIDEEMDANEQDPTHIVDNKWTFAEKEADPDNPKRMRRVVVDRNGEKLRHWTEYEGEPREQGEEFAGYTMSIKPRDPVTEDMEGTKSLNDEQKYEEEQGQDLEYNVEHDPDDHFREPHILDTQTQRETEDEFIIAPASTLGSKAGAKNRSYVIGGEEMPPTIWQGREWMTFARSWDNIRKNGATPSDEEVAQHLKTILGEARPDIPISAPREPKPQEYIWSSIPDADPEHMLLDDAEWKTQNIKQLQPKSWFMEARIRYKKKLHLVRSKYLREYTAVKKLHDENVLARWEQQMANRARRDELRLRRAEVCLIKNIEQDQRAAARRAKKRVTSRFTRMNKEMKQRRLHLHIFNYMLRERELHWIQPKIDATTGEVVHNKNLTTKLFEKDSFAVGFWPKHPVEERQERLDEINRRKAAKQATR